MNYLKPLILTLTVASSVWSFGCGSKLQGGATDTNTNWLTACDEDAECGSDLACLCGVCSQSCAGDNACSALSTDAVCRTEAEACGSDAVSLCVLDSTELPGSSESSNGGMSAGPSGNDSGAPPEVNDAAAPTPPEDGASGSAAGDSATDGGSNQGGAGGANDGGLNNGGADNGGANNGGSSGANDGGAAGLDCPVPQGTDFDASTFMPNGCFLGLNTPADTLITSEAEFKNVYQCGPDAGSGIDFTQKQLLLIVVSERTQASLNYAHIDDADDVVVGVESPVYCGGAAPPDTIVAVLMDKTLRAPTAKICSSGMCQGPPVP